MLLDLIYDGLILEDRAVVREIDFLRLFRQLYYAASRVLVALLESL